MCAFMNGDDPPEHYTEAFARSRGRFSAGDPAQMAKNAGARLKDDGSTITLVSLGRGLQVHHPEGKVRFTDDLRRPVWQWRLITLNYLSRADGTKPTGELVAFRQLQGGRAYAHAFADRTVSRLSGLIDQYSQDALRAALRQLDADWAKLGDISAVLFFMPRFPITLSLYRGDDEMPSSANIVFDSSANHYLHTEDAAVAAGITVQQLCRAAQKQQELGRPDGGAPGR